MLYKHCHRVPRFGEMVTSNTAILNITVYDHYLLNFHFIYFLMNEGTCNKMKVTKQSPRDKHTSTCCIHVVDLQNEHRPF